MKTNMHLYLQSHLALTNGASVDSVIDILQTGNSYGVKSENYIQECTLKTLDC